MPANDPGAYALTPEQLKALITEAGLSVRDLLPKLTEAEQEALVRLSTTDDAVAEALGGVLGNIPGPPGLMGMKVPKLGRLGRPVSQLRSATSRTGRPPSDAPAIRPGKTPPNVITRDPTEYAVPTHMKTRPSMGPAGPGGVVVEGEGVINSLGSTLAAVLAALGLGGTAAESAGPQKRRAY